MTLLPRPSVDTCLSPAPSLLLSLSPAVTLPPVSPSPEESWAGVEDALDESTNLGSGAAP